MDCTMHSELSHEDKNKRISENTERKNKENKKKQLRYTMISFMGILCIWKVLSLFFSPLVVPPVSIVAGSLIKIFTTIDFYQMIGLTIMRQFIGLGIGVSFGLILGMVMGKNRMIRGLFMPVVTLFQTIPPVSWVVLALVWFGFNSKPAIFIVVIATIPIITINICEGIENMDQGLLEMADVYHFSKWKKISQVEFPSIMTHFKSAFKVALGNGWKIAVMGEVLTTSDGIGGMIKTARLNIEPESIIAWSVVVVLLFYLSNCMLDWIFQHMGNDFGG